MGLWGALLHVKWKLTCSFRGAEGEFSVVCGSEREVREGFRQLWRVEHLKVTKEIDMTDMEMYAATAQMYSIGADNIPTSSGSGMVIVMNGKKLLLTVEHLLNLKERLGVHIDHEKNGSMLYVPSDYGRLVGASMNTGSVENVDFLWFQLPLEQKIFRSSVLPIEGRNHIECKEYDICDVHDVSASDLYAFAGAIKGRKASLPNGNLTAIISDLQIHQNLTLDKVEGMYAVFKLPYGKHPGHAMFQGCSGAPILNATGNPVALVSSGDRVANTVTGVLLRPLCEMIGLMI